MQGKYQKKSPEQYIMFKCLLSSYYVQNAMLGASGEKEPESCALKNG